MAFSFGSPSSFATSAMAPSNVQAQNGPDLEEISTEGLGFQTIAGEAKVRLLPTPWPSDALPLPTASLLSIASERGLLAAAGPDSVILASTDAVREAYKAPDGGNIKSFSPQLTLNPGARISQVVFSANEEYLVLSAENGGGLAVYQTSSLIQGSTQSAFEIGTNGTAVRQLLPNPTANTAELFGVVTMQGQLMMANLQSKQFIGGPQGQILREGVSCVSWSNKGKQLVAGLADASCIQMTPKGEVKAELPAPSGLEGDQHVSSIYWLENDIFLTAHTPSAPPSGVPPVTTYHILTRSKQPDKTITYQKLPELSPPFGLDRSPPFQFMCRLKDFPPSLTDVIAVASTASVDVSLVTRSKSPLTADIAPEKAVNVFTTTVMADDSRRAQLPMTEDLTDTSPIGMAWDLSSKDKVKRPLPREEYEESPGPLPAVMVLNNDGILASWWLVFAESIRRGTSYPGLTAIGGASNQPSRVQNQASPFAATPSSSGSAFTGSSFGKPSTPLAASNAAIEDNAAPAFRSTATFGSAFGAPSGLAQKSSPWGGNTSTTSAFGQPSFGSNSGLGGGTSTFGMAGGLGNRSSPWGTSSSTTAATGSVFGNTGKLGTQSSPFSSTASSRAFGSNEAPNSSGFASFANSGGFAAAAPSSGSSQSIFGKPATGGAFSTSADSAHVLGQAEKSDGPKSIFGGGGGFNLGSTFKAEGTAATDDPKPTGDPTTSLLGSNFGAALGDAGASQSKDADMDEGEEASSQPANAPEGQKQPQPSAPKLSSPKFHFPKVDNSRGSSLFGTSAQDTSAPTEIQASRPAGFSFGSASPSMGDQNENSKPDDRPRPSIETSPKIKEEPQSDDVSISPLNEDEAKPPEGFDAGDESTKATKDEPPETPAASRTGSPDSPVPPESTSKTTFAAGDSSQSSKSSDDAPLPPNFLPTKSKLQEVEAAQPAPSPSTEDLDQEQTVPEEGEVEEDISGGLDDEGSGVDVGQEISPASSKDSSKNTTGNSFGFSAGKYSPENTFHAAKAESNSQRPPRFGELGKPVVPLFPSSRPQESPRSPSPVRLGPRLDTLRPESSRSMSAPGLGRPLFQLPTKASHPVAPSKPQESAKEIRNRERERLLDERNKQFAEEHQTLSDKEDEENRKVLAMEVSPSKVLDKFIAHQDYVGHIDKPGIPGQIEKVFRDINSMIDTLGLNARSLMAFIRAHEDQSNGGGRGHKNLENLDQWCLVDVGYLESVEEDLSVKLDEDKLQDVSGKLAEIREMHGALAQFRRQTRDLNRTINLNKNSAKSEAAAQRPLNLDQETQLKELRKAFKELQKHLAEAEQGIVMLRTKLASQANGQPTKGKAPLKRPTVEAVENTIRKMTNMITQKNKDIGLLCSQLDDLRVHPPSTSGLLEHENLGASRQGSPSAFTGFYPGSASRKSRRTLWRSGYSPSPSMSPCKESSLRGAPATNGAFLDVSGFLSKEEVDEHRIRAKRRQEINEVVKDAFGKARLKVRALD